MVDTRLQQCGCTATPLPPKSLRQMTIDIRIDFCPLHAAAPELLEALNRAAKLAHKNYVLVRFKDRDGCFDACWDRLGVNKGHTSLCERARALWARLEVK